jgi:5'(3')-deoxyribonucleotidase
VAEPKKLVIGCDLDAILIDLIRPWLDWYNKLHDDKITVDEITQYKVEKFATKTDRMFAFFDDHTNYTNCPVLPGAAEGLKELSEAGHDIVIATATAGQTASLKWHLVAKVAPWLHENDVMVGSRKELLCLDVFIDDAPKNVVKYRNRWPNAHILTIAYPYNRDIKSLVNCYAMDHNNTHQAWGEMCNYIRELSNRG